MTLIRIHCTFILWNHTWDINYLFEVALHRLVCKQGDRTHEVSDKNKVAFRLHVESDYIVQVTALDSKFFVGRPLKQPNLQQKPTTILTIVDATAFHKMHKL